MGDDLRGIKNRDYRDLIRAAVDQGWVATVTDHVRLDPPPGNRGGPVFAAKTSKGGRGERNLRSILRNHGVKC